MGADDAEPTCTMSRSNGNGSIAQGGRSIKLPRRKKAQTRENDLSLVPLADEI